VAALKGDRMPERTPSQNAAEILRMVADIQKDIGELSIAMMAQHSTLRDLFPDFESRYASKEKDAAILRVKNEYEHKIRVLLEAADRMSKS
jgi:hypothetical protein